MKMIQKVNLILRIFSLSESIMPVRSCTINGKPGYKWGSQGKCYPYNAANTQSRNRAKAKAAKQGRAIKAN